MRKVSVICGIRNEKLTIEKCLQSLINQTYRNKEIIIVDDDSTDGTSEIAKSFAEKYPFVRYYRVKHKPGAPAWPRIFGIDKSKGSIIAPVEGDGCYSEKYIELCVKELNNPKVGGAIGKIRVWLLHNTFVSRYKDVLYRMRYDNIEQVNKEIKEGKVAAWVFPKKVYHEVGGYKEESGWAADIDFTKRLLKAGYEVVYLPEALWQHRWEELWPKIISYRYKVGQLQYNFHKKNKKMIQQVLYFLSIFPIIALGFFSIKLALFLFVLHNLPMFRNGVKNFRKAKGIKRRHYLLLAPLISYIDNISHAIGFSKAHLFKKSAKNL